MSMNSIANDRATIEAMLADPEVRRLRDELYLAIGKYKYTYNFNWLDRPIIQLPQDMIAVQEIIWDVNPDLIIETGVAHGGSLMLSASILELIGGDGEVLGVDVDIRKPNREAIESHPLAKRVRLLEGSSVDSETIAKVRSTAAGKKRIMVMLDSDHIHDHVLAELNLYGPLVTKDSYLIVFDTLIEDMPEDAFRGQRWHKGNNPKTAVLEYLKSTERFVIDQDLENRILLTVAPSGYLKCVAD